MLQFVREYGLLGVTVRDLREGRITDPGNDPSEIAAGLILAVATMEQVADFRVGVSALRRAQEMAAELNAPGGANRYRLADVDDCYGFFPGPPTSAKQARYQFDWIVNTGLSAFAIRSKTVGRRHVLVAEPSSLSLFSIACLELANAFDRGLPWRKCALGGCEQLFQPARSDQIYHDASCGRVQASREYRLRKKRKAAK
jgi:hypothetical protein